METLNTSLTTAKSNGSNTIETVFNSLNLDAIAKALNEFFDTNNICLSKKMVEFYNGTYAVITSNDLISNFGIMAKHLFSDIKLECNFKLTTPEEMEEPGYCLNFDLKYNHPNNSGSNGLSSVRLCYNPKDESCMIYAEGYKQIKTFKDGMWLNIVHI